MGWLKTLLNGVREITSTFVDKRSGNGRARYSMMDIGMAAFSLFFMQNESFLAYQRRLQGKRGQSNCQTLFEMERIPTDNHIRSMLDEVPACSLQPCFDQHLDVLHKSEALPHFQVLGERVLIALDGTEYFTSQKLGCPSCQTRKRTNGTVECYHSLLAGTIVVPKDNHVVSLMPEFIIPQDGYEKQDCEQKAALRWLERHHERVAKLNPIYLGDDLFCHQPLLESITTKQADFLMVCKPQTHKTLYDFIQGARLPTYQQTHRRGKKTLLYRYQWMSGLPLRAGDDALTVNWLSIEIVNEQGETIYRNAFATSLPVSQQNVVELVQCARARWKIENGSFNVLKNNGYHLEHNFGHGKKHLAMIFAVLNLLAFNIHTLSGLLDSLWRAAIAKSGARTRFFNNLCALTTYLLFPSWEALLQTVVDEKPPNHVMSINQT